MNLCCQCVNSEIKNDILISSEMCYTCADYSNYWFKNNKEV